MLLMLEGTNMSATPTYLNDELYQYILQMSVKETDVLKELREITQKMPGAQMQICPDQGQFMYWLAKLINAKKCLEIGVFTGYSSLWTAMALPADGKIIACDINPHTSEIAQSYWLKAGVAEKIELRLGPALESIANLKKEQQLFDFAFIDADKKNYIQYYEQVLELIRPGGIILVDNTLWDGLVAYSPKDEQTEIIHQLNKKIFENKNVDACLLSIGDGLTMIRKLS